ncbi:MAG TPA: FAD-dependent oxidoreductase [Symbiobacteriaceae bacterium]|nr:FAD-dependent oxidoreductase [Symbiobacteriaceae bacterium]
MCLYRRLMALSLASAVLFVLFLPLPSKAVAPSQPDAERYDVAVLGGTPEGVAAAVAAARLGRRVLLVEPRSRLGGLLVHGGLNSLDLNRAPGGALLNGGIFAELYSRLEGDSFDTNTAAATLHDMVLREKLITLWTGTEIREPVVAGGQVAGVWVRGPGGPALVVADRFVDATEDADVAAAAGVAFTVGREDYTGVRDGQAATLVFRLKGVDWRRAVQHLAADGDDYTGATERSLWGYGEVMHRYQPRSTRIAMRGLNVGRQNDGTVLINALWIFGVDPLSPAAREAGMAEAVAELPAVVSYIRAHCPGFEQAELAGTAAELYVRESRHMSGALHFLTIDDVLEHRDQPDAIGYGSYAVDIQAAGPHERVQIVGAPTQYAIPLRSLVPQNLSNLAVASRSAGYSSLAHGSARTIPVGMAAGQAAGVAAAVSLAHGVGFPELARTPGYVRLVQGELRAQGVRLAPFSQPSPLAGHPFADDVRHFRRLGLITAGYGNDYGLDAPVTGAELADFVARAGAALGRPVRSVAVARLAGGGAPMTRGMLYRAARRVLFPERVRLGAGAGIR